MARGLFFGLTTIDVFSFVDQQPGPNQKIKTRGQAVCAGGPAANAAVAFSALDNEACLVSGVGNHPIGALGLLDLQQHGVKIHDHCADPDALPVISSIIVNTTNGDRCAVYSDPGSRSLLSVSDYGQYGKDCSIILFDGFYLDKALYVAKAADDNTVTVLDGGSWKDGLEKLFPFIDYAICSADFKVPGCSTDQDLLVYLADAGIIGTAISRGPEQIVYEYQGVRGLVPVSPVKAIDTLGAGDILHGAFCHYILSNPFEKSIELAAQTASQSCAYQGTREWINHLTPQGEKYEI